MSQAEIVALLPYKNEINADYNCSKNQSYWFTAIDLIVLGICSFFCFKLLFDRKFFLQTFSQEKEKESLAVSEVKNDLDS